LIDAFTSTSTWLPPFLRYHSPSRPEIACPMRDESQLKGMKLTSTSRSSLLYLTFTLTVTFCRTYPLVLNHAELLELIWMRSVVPMLLVLPESQRQALKHYYDPIRNIGTFIRCWVLTHVSTIKEEVCASLWISAPSHLLNITQTASCNRPTSSSLCKYSRKTVQSNTSRNDREAR